MATKEEMLASAAQRKLERMRHDREAHESAQRHLSTEAREKLPAKDFALPGGRYPIEDKAHARNALARGAQHASPEELSEIKRKVKAKYPDIEVT